MDVVYTCCCGIDVHKKMFVACLLTTRDGHRHTDLRTFSTMTADILRCADWLAAAGCQHIALESTGVYWKPLYNLLEDRFSLLIANAQHLKAVPGRKTDCKDAEWIADLLQHGLLRASFIPPAPQRALRDLTRYRTSLVEDRTRAINRLHKTLEDTNYKLDSVVSDLRGISAQAMLKALVDGQTDPGMRADLAQGKLRQKRPQLLQALDGRLKPHQRFLLSELLAQIEYLDEAITTVSTEIDTQLTAAEADIARLDTIPGVSKRVAEIILAEVGSDMSRFPSAKHLASWAGMCPGNNESAGKRLSGHTRKGSRWLRYILTEAAQAAARTHTYLGVQFQRIAQRRGRNKAMVAVGHSILVIMYHVLRDKKAFVDLGVAYLDEHEKQMRETHLRRQLEGLGYTVTLQPAVPVP